MRTAVISDLHLASGGGGDVLRHERFRDLLAERLDGIERLVLLGDVIELRDRPLAESLERCRDTLAALGRIAAKAEVVIVAGNHDHHLIEPWLAVPFGVGMGLTLDESALLLELEDVYWTREGLLSVQITLTVMAMLGALALGLRFLRRGEELVLVPAAVSTEADLISRHGDATAA